MQEEFSLPNLRHLLGVVAVADQGTLSAAAEIVNLSQPALTQGLSRIEDTLGAEIFHRTSRGMVLTEPGALFTERARRGIIFLQRAGEITGRANLARMVTLGQIRALVATVESGGFRAAAVQLGLEPSSVSRAYRDFEQACEAQFLERTSAGLRPTVQAEKVARFCKLALAEFRQAHYDFRGWQGRYEGRLAIGCLPLAQPIILPDALARFAPEFPNVAPQIVDGYYASLARGLLRGDLDLMIGALRKDDLPDGLLQRPLFTDSLVIVARPDHPLVAAPHVDAAALARYPWVAPRMGAPARSYFEDLLGRLDIPEGVPRPIETGAHAVMGGILARTDRLTVISASQVRREIEQGTLGRVRFPLPDTRREIGVTVSEDWLPSSPQRRFLELLEVAVEAATESG